MGVLVAECNINQARKRSERMLEEIVGSREIGKRKHKNIPPLELEGWASPPAFWTYRHTDL